MNAYPIHEIRLGQNGYPKSLATTAGAPEVLYCRGDLSLLERPGVAVVGTRQATDYGTETTRRFAGVLARAGTVVVSGLALGIDAVAHRTVLDAGGKTVAVLGGGVDDDTIGPRQNFPLARAILAHGGLILSEHPAGMPADKWTFPARNRIISGLSSAVIVTEAAARSGALITARLAAEQGRDVYAVPGSIFWPRSEGPNRLIADGAGMLASVDDLRRAFALDDAKRETVSTHDPLERRIVAILDDGPTHLDSIIASLDLPAPRIMAALSRMEIGGAVLRSQDGRYRTA